MKSAYNGTFCILPYKPLKPLTEAGGRFEVTLERLADNICEKARFYVKFTDLTTHAWLDVEWYQPDRHSPWDVRVSNRHPNVMVFCWHQYGFKTLMKIVDQNVPNACQGYRRELR